MSRGIIPFATGGVGGVPGGGFGSAAEATSGGLTVYSTLAGHFTATRYSDTQVDLAGGFPSIDSYAQFVMAEAWDSSGVYVGSYSPQTNVFAWDSANSRLTVTGALFPASGVVHVTVLGPDRTHNRLADAVKTLIGNPYELAGDDAAIPLITTAQNFTDSWVDIGSEIYLFGKSGMTLYFTLDVNDDSDLRFRVLAKHEQGGAEEYTLPIKTIGSSVVAVEDLYYEFTDDSDQLIAVPIETNGEVPWVQVQIQRGTNGAGVAAQVDALAYTRGTFGGRTS